MSSTSQAPVLDPQLAAALNQELHRYARLQHILKSQVAPLVPAGLDMAAFSLLLILVGGGPRRQGELAELSMLDPSTVSRHVGQLARVGFVERRPHPQDGRAVQLVATAEGERVAEEIAARRRHAMALALAQWQPDDVRQLTALLGRLNDDLDAFRPHFVEALVGAPAPSGDPLPPGPGTDTVVAAGTATADPLPEPRTPDQENA